MKIKRNIAVSDSGFVFNPTTGESFSTNPIGLEIIMALKSHQGPAQIQASILDRYTTDQVTVEKDLSDFFDMLARLDLLEQDEKNQD